MSNGYSMHTLYKNTNTSQTNLILRRISQDMYYTI